MIHGDPNYGGLARVIRWHPPEHFGNGSVLASLDRDENVLHVNRTLFDRLEPGEQRKVLHTNDQMVWAATTGQPIAIY